MARKWPNPSCCSRLNIFKGGSIKPLSSSRVTVVKVGFFLMPLCYNDLSGSVLRPRLNLNVHLLQVFTTLSLQTKWIKTAPQALSSGVGGAFADSSVILYWSLSTYLMDEVWLNNFSMSESALTSSLSSFSAWTKWIHWLLDICWSCWEHNKCSHCLLVKTSYLKKTKWPFFGFDDPFCQMSCCMFYIRIKVIFSAF